jgi:hypothetical protein
MLDDVFLWQVRIFLYCFYSFILGIVHLFHAPVNTKVLSFSLTAELLGCDYRRNYFFNRVAVAAGSVIPRPVWDDSTLV